MKKLKNTMLLLFVLSIGMLFTNVEAFAKVSSTEIQSFDITPMSKTSNYVVGKQYKVTAKATSINNPEYRFWVGNLKTGKWKILKDYSSSNTITWTPTQSGKFEVSVHVRDKKSKVAYEAVKYEDIDVISSTEQGTSIKTVIKNLSIENLNVNSKYIIGNECKITATAVSTNEPQYKFWVIDVKTGEKKLLKDYGESNSITWTPTNKGKFGISVYVRDKKSKVAYECVEYKDIDVIENINPSKPVKTNVKNFSIESLDGNSKYVIGNKYKVTANAVSTNNPQYRFWVGNLDTGKWKILKDYSSTNTITWVPKEKGRFEVSVHVRDSKSKASYESVKFKDIDIVSKEGEGSESSNKPDENVKPKPDIKTTVKGFSIQSLDGSSKYVIGNRYKVTANAVSTNNPQYRFWVGNLDTGKWKILKDYSSTNTITWVPTENGRFEVSVHVRDSKSKAKYEAVKYEDLDVVESVNPGKPIKTNVKNFLIESLDGNSKYVIGNRYKVTANAVSTNNPQYRFWVGNLDTGKWRILKDYSSTNTITWVPTEKGRIEVSVHVRDSKSKASYEAVKFKDIYADFGVHTQSRKQSQLQTNLVNYLLKSKSNRDSVMNRAIQLHGGNESNTCVYFTSEALRRTGLTKLPTYVANTRQLSTKLTSYGWVKCTDYTKLLPGDICFSINGGTGYPTHAYTFVSWVKEGNYEWANIIDNQRSRFNGEPLHKRTISCNTEWFDKFQYFMYKPR